MTFAQKRRRLLAINDRIERLEKERARLAARLQAKCRHESLVEIDGESTSYGFEPSTRLCLICGLEETDRTFRILRNEPIKSGMSPQTFDRFRKLQPLPKGARS